MICIPFESVLLSEGLFVFADVGPRFVATMIGAL